jgi:hypothetical protein
MRNVSASHVHRVKDRNAVFQDLSFGNLKQPVQIAVAGCVREVFAIELKLHLLMMMSGLDRYLEFKERTIVELPIRIS